MGKYKVYWRVFRLWLVSTYKQVLINYPILEVRYAAL